MVALVLKATQNCNSNCAYCSEYRGVRTGASLNLELMGGIYAGIDRFLTERPEEQVQILLHGGEPLLLGHGFFAALPELEEQICPRTGDRISYGIQTNLTLFDETFAGCFRRLGILSVGTSYDPEEHVRGFSEEIDTIGYNRAFMRALRVLERRGLEWWMIYVVTRRSLANPLGVFSLLTALQPRGNITLNPVLITGQDRFGLAITPREYGGFLSAILPAWWKSRDRLSRLGPLGPVTEAVVKRQTNPEGLNFGACGPSLNALEVDTDGGLSAIGPPEMGGSRKYGHFADTTLGEAIEMHREAEAKRRSAVLEDSRCRSCAIELLCHGEAPFPEALSQNSFVGPGPWCEARIMLVELVRRS